jgi:hypothetical protein
MSTNNDTLTLTNNNVRTNYTNGDHVAAAQIRYIDGSIPQLKLSNNNINNNNDRNYYDNEEQERGAIRLSEPLYSDGKNVYNTKYIFSDTQPLNPNKIPNNNSHYRNKSMTQQIEYININDNTRYDVSNSSFFFPYCFMLSVNHNQYV